MSKYPKDKINNHEVKFLCHDNILGEWRYSFTHSTSALDGSEWSSSRPGRFTPRKEPPLSTG